MEVTEKIVCLENTKGSLKVSRATLRSLGKQQISFLSKHSIIDRAACRQGWNEFLDVRGQTRILEAIEACNSCDKIEDCNSCEKTRFIFREVSEYGGIGSLKLLKRLKKSSLVKTPDQGLISSTITLIDNRIGLESRISRSRFWLLAILLFHVVLVAISTIFMRSTIAGFAMAVGSLVLIIECIIVFFHERKNSNKR